MLYIIYITIAGVAAGVLLTLVSETFAYQMSRLLEAALDSFEYRRALRAEQRGEILRRQHDGDAPRRFDVPYRARVGISL